MRKTKTTAANTPEEIEKRRKDIMKCLDALVDLREINRAIPAAIA